jgi:putative nucleotidyltransferase with HDIG domain
VIIKDFKAKVLKMISYLPPIPTVMVELVQALNDENIELNVLGRIIAKDPSMSVNVLKVANSAFYKLPVKVNTIEHAVRMLGTREIASLCIACTAGKTLKAPVNQPTIDLSMFWQHSVATGVISKVLCGELGIQTQNNIYLAGLIHDVGKIILDRFMHDVYKEIVKITYNDNVSVTEAEQRVIGESHARVGGWLMEAWNLPSIFIDVANHHHSVMETQEDNRLEVAIVSLSNQLARLKSFGFGGDMSGVVLADIDAWKIIDEAYPQIKNLDVVKFIWDLDEAYNEIVAMEKIINN